MKQTGFRYIFNRKKTLNTQGKALVQLEVRTGGVKRYYSMNIYLEPHQWNGRVVNHPKQKSYNNILDRQILDLENFDLEQVRLGRYVTINSFHDFLKRENFDSFIEYFIQNQDSLLVSLYNKKACNNNQAALDKYYNHKSYYRVFYFLEQYNQNIYIRYQVCRYLPRLEVHL